MRPHRAKLPTKEDLFGETLTTGTFKISNQTASQEKEAPVIAEKPAQGAKGPHVQVCVWLEPKVAAAIEQAKAQLLLDYGLKATKSKIVEVALQHVLADTELLYQLLKAEG